MNIYAQLTAAQRNQQRRRMADAGGNVIGGGIGFGTTYGQPVAANQLRLNTPTPRMITPPPPPPPPSPFGTQLKNVFGRVGDFVKDDRRFGDFAAGAQILSGTPLADALAVRNTINPITTTSDKIGKLFNVRNNITGTLTGEQVTELQVSKIKEIQENPELSLEEVGEFNPELETNKPEKGFVRVVEDGVPRDFAIEGSAAFNTVKQDIEKSRGVYNQATFEKQKAATNLSVINGFLNNPPKIVQAFFSALNIQPPYDGGNAVAAFLASPAAEARTVLGAINNLKINNFIQTLQTMRDNSKTGGAVGQVSNLELTQFQQANTPLDAGASDFRSRVKQNVDQIVKKAEEVQQRALRDIDSSNLQLFEKNRVGFNPESLEKKVTIGGD